MKFHTVGQVLVLLPKVLVLNLRLVHSNKVDHDDCHGDDDDHNDRQTDENYDHHDDLHDDDEDEGDDMHSNAMQVHPASQTKAQDQSQKPMLCSKIHCTEIHCTKKQSTEIHCIAQNYIALVFLLL